MSANRPKEWINQHSTFYQIERFRGSCKGSAYDIAEANALDLGLVEAKSAPDYPCPTWLLGKRCKFYCGSGCICEPFGGRVVTTGIPDHGTSYYSATNPHYLPGERLIVWQPYGGIRAEECQLLMDLCAEHPIAFDITPCSPWYPGSTLGIYLTASDLETRKRLASQPVARRVEARKGTR